jgi:hypothetical protein
VNTRRTFSPAVIAVSVAVALVLTGCGDRSTPSPTKHPSSSASAKAGPPKPTHTATSAPTPTAAALVPGSVQFSHDDLTVMSTTSTPIVHLPWNSDPATVVTQLNGYLGSTAPIVNTPAGNCSNATSSASWGQALRLYWSTDPSEQDSTRRYFAQSRAATVGAVTIETYQGFKVGDSSLTYLNSVPNTTTPNGYGQLWSDLDADDWGIEVDYDNHVINLIASPANVHEDC